MGGILHQVAGCCPAARTETGHCLYHVVGGIGQCRILPDECVHRLRIQHLLVVEHNAVYRIRAAVVGGEVFVHGDFIATIGFFGDDKVVAVAFEGEIVRRIAVGYPQSIGAVRRSVQVHDEVFAEIALDDVAVGTCAAGQIVAAAAAGEFVVALPTVEAVVAVFAVKFVMTCLTIQHIIARTANQGVVAGIAVYPIVAAARFDQAA